MTLPSIRITNLLITIFTALMMLIAVLYFQETLHLLPCPLCVSQRIFAIAAGVIALIAFVHNPEDRGRKIYAALTAIAALGGASISGRQVWLQSLPADQIPACGPTLDWMFETNFPMQEILSAMFFGEGSCAEIKWQFLGLSIPGWTLVAFVFLIGVAVFQFLRSNKLD